MQQSIILSIILFASFCAHAMDYSDSASSVQAASSSSPVSFDRLKMVLSFSESLLLGQGRIESPMKGRITFPHYAKPNKTYNQPIQEALDQYKRFREAMPLAQEKDVMASAFRIFDSVSIRKKITKEGVDSLIRYMPILDKLFWQSLRVIAINDLFTIHDEAQLATNIDKLLQNNKDLAPQEVREFITSRFALIKALKEKNGAAINEASKRALPVSWLPPLYMFLKSEFEDSPLFKKEAQSVSPAESVQAAALATAPSPDSLLFLGILAAAAGAGKKDQGCSQQ